VPYLSASVMVIHYEEALYQVYAPLPLPIGCSKMSGIRQSSYSDSWGDVEYPVLR